VAKKLQGRLASLVGPRCGRNQLDALRGFGYTIDRETFYILSSAKAGSGILWEGEEL
jgi:hypothetical protein